MRSTSSLFDLEDDFQASSLKVFKSKKLWSEFQAELSAENVTNPTAVKMKLRQFISEREDELSGVNSGAGGSTPNLKVQAKRRGSGFALGKLWNPLDGNKTNETFGEAENPQKPELLSRLINPGEGGQVSGLDDSKRKSWVFTEAKDQEKTKPKRNSLFTPWRRDTGSTSDLTTSFTTDIRRGSHNSLASIDSRASELEEIRRLDTSNRRGSYHDDLFEDFYVTQVKRFSISDRDNDNDNDHAQDGQIEEGEASFIRKRASIDLDESPDFYTSRPTIVPDLCGLEVECKRNDTNSAQDSAVAKVASLHQRSSSEIEGESDDDKSNNGVFEFPATSRKIYQSRCSDCDSSRDLSSFIDEANSLASSVHLPEGKIVTLSQLSGMQPKPVSKRGMSDKSSECSLQDSLPDITESMENQASASEGQKRDWLRFSWGPRNEIKSSVLDESERTSTTLNEAALPSNRRFSAKRASLNVRLLSGQSRSNQDLTEATSVNVDENPVNPSTNAPEVKRFSWGFRREPERTLAATQESDAAPNEDSNRSSGIFIDPSLFDEIRGDTSKKESHDDHVDWGEINDCEAKRPDFTEDLLQMAHLHLMNSDDASNKSEDSSQEKTTVEVPTFNHATVNTSFAIDDNSCCTNDSDAAVVLQI